MKYWKGNLDSQKQGQIGTMDDDGFVPDSQATTREEYDMYVSLQPIPPIQKDFKDLFGKALTATAKIDLIAEKLGLL
jgi:hypothetical protein